MDEWNEYIQTIIPIKKSNRYVNPINKEKIAINDNNILNFTNRVNTISNSINLSRTQKRKFKSEVKLDLHGIHPNLINDTITNFCTKAILYNFQFATIITGKGKGIIKQHVLDWIMSSNLVSYYFEIKDSQRECGAIGIKLVNL